MLATRNNKHDIWFPVRSGSPEFHIWQGKGRTPSPSQQLPPRHGGQLNL